MINFIQHNYSHKDFVIVNRVINEQYQKEQNNEFAQFTIKKVGNGDDDDKGVNSGEVSQTKSRDKSGLTIGHIGTEFNLESRNGNEISQGMSINAISCSGDGDDRNTAMRESRLDSCGVQGLNKGDDTSQNQKQMSQLKTQQKNAIDKQFAYNEYKRKKKGGHEGIQTPFSALNPEVENEKTKKFINEMFNTAVHNSQIKNREITDEERRKIEIQTKVAQIMADQQMQDSKFYIQAEKKRQETESKIRRFRKKIQYYQDTNYWERT